MAEAAPRHASDGAVDELLAFHGDQRTVGIAGNRRVEGGRRLAIDGAQYVALGEDAVAAGALRRGRRRFDEDRADALFHHRRQRRAQRGATGNGDRRLAHNVGDAVAVGEAVDAGIFGHAFRGDAPVARHVVPAGPRLPLQLRGQAAADPLGLRQGDDALVAQARQQRLEDPAGGLRVAQGAVALADRLGGSHLLIGLTVVAAGTSAPELVVCLIAVLDGAPGIAIGNVVGSNIANILLVLGAPALGRRIIQSRQAGA